MLSNTYQKLVLQPLGLNRETSLILWLLLFFGFIVVSSLWYYNGNVPVTLYVVWTVSIVMVSFARPIYSLYILMFQILLFDQVQLRGFEPLTYAPEYFRNLKEISYLPYMSSGVFNGIELHLGVLSFALLLHFAINKNNKLRPIPVWPAFLLFFGWFLFSFLYGLKSGGDFLTAIWEIRALFYLCILYLLVPQIIQTKKQIYTLMWFLIIPITIKMLQGASRFAYVGFSTVGYDALTSNEDPVFMVTLFILLLAFFVNKVDNKQKLWLLVFLIPLLIGFYAGQRRASFASLLVTFSVFVVILPPLIRWNFLKKMAPVLMVVLLYVAAFWNSNSALAGPVELIKSGLVTPEKEENMRDYYSNLYRDLENYNLAATAKNNTLVGIGFGNKYEKPLSLANISYPLRDYIPHNQILWIYIKMGLIGFILFFYFFNSFAFKSMAIYMKLNDPYFKSLIVVIVLAMLNQVVVSYFDVMMTFYRTSAYVGCLMGLLPAIEAIATEEEEEEAETESSDKKDAP